MNETCNPCVPNESVKWNPYNKVVQCHKCGKIYVPEMDIEEAYRQKMIEDIKSGKLSYDKR